MTTFTSPGTTGWNIVSRTDATGATTWLWRAWHNDAMEANSAATCAEAQADATEAHKRLSEL